MMNEEKRELHATQNIEIPETKSEMLYAIIVLAIRHHFLNVIILALLLGWAIHKIEPALKEMAEANVHLTKAIEKATVNQQADREAVRELTRAMVANSDAMLETLRARDR